MNICICMYVCIYIHIALKTFNSHSNPMKRLLLLFPTEEIEARRGDLLSSGHTDSNWLVS